jgi:PTS system mannose-specific IID component
MGSLISAAWPAELSLQSGAQVPPSAMVSWQAALLVAFFYYLSQSAWLAGLGFWTLYRPVVGGLVVGAILGDVPAGVRAGAVINLAYLGFVATGGALPADISLAGYIGTVLVVATHLDPSAALALMVPVGVLGSLIYQLRMTLDVVLAHWADRYADRADARGLALCNVLLPQALLLLISVPPCFIGAFYGPQWLERLVEGMPGWLLPGLGAVGNMLLAFGIAMNLRLLWQPVTAAYFTAGFILTTVTHIPMLAWGVLAVSVAMIHVHLQYGRHGDCPEPAQPKDRPDDLLAGGRRGVSLSAEGSLLRRRDLQRVWLNWLFFSHACYNYERMQGIGFAHALAPALRRIYSRKEDLAAALKRHTVYYNSEPNVGMLVHGVVLALEEAHARGLQVSEQAIQATKASLMGPLSGLGDTLIQGALAPLLLSVGISLAREGSVLGPCLYIVCMAAIIWLVSWRMLVIGYRQGSARAASLLQRGVWRRFLSGAEVVGSIVLAVLAVGFVQVVTPLRFQIGQLTLRLQEDVLDRLMLHLLPFGLVLLYVWLLGRRIPPAWIVVGTVLLGLGTHLIGLL